jgi:tagaturonate reductase
MSHPELRSFLDALLLDEIVPSVPLPRAEALAYAETVLERFANPWLEHEWRVIATNQTAKLRLRVVPSLVGYIEQFGTIPEQLVRAFAASLRYSRGILRVNSGEGEGWWQGASYRIVDVDFDLIDWHWRSVDSTATAAVIPETTLARFAASVLSDDLIWGRDLTTLPGLKLAVVHALMALELSGAT